MRNSLAAAQQRAADAAQRQLVPIIAVLFLLAISSILFVCVWWFGERTGAAELQAKVDSGDLDALLAFVVTNSYSLNLNRNAVAELRPLVPKTAEGLQKVSVAATNRWARGPGHLNDEVGRLLHQLSKGIENILNRGN